MAALLQLAESWMGLSTRVLQRERLPALPLKAKHWLRE